MPVLTVFAVFCWRYERFWFHKSFCLTYSSIACLAFPFTLQYWSDVSRPCSNLFPTFLVVLSWCALT